MKSVKYFLAILFIYSSIIISAQEEYRIQPDKKKIGADLIKRLFTDLVKNEIDTAKSINWLFEFTHHDSTELVTLLTLYSDYEPNIEIDTILVDHSSLEEKYIVDLVENEIYDQQSLHEKVKQLNKIFKRNRVSLSGLGITIPNNEAAPLSAFSKSKNEIADKDGLTLTGTVRNASTAKPISFVNIGIENKNVGTLSSLDGKYAIQIPKGNISDSLTFSFVGHKAIKKAIAAFKKDETILLVEEAYILEGVEINTDKQAKSIILGERKKGKNTGFINGKGAGAEAAEKIIPPKSKSIYLNRTEIFINNRLKKPFQFLVNVYEMDSVTGLPGKNILRKPLLLESDIESGWVGVSLNDQQIIIDQPVFISFQWISEDSKNPTISLKGRKGYIRSISMGKWIETRDFSWAIKVEGTILD